MRRTFPFFLIFLLIFSIKNQAEPVPKKLIKQIAFNFLTHKTQNRDLKITSVENYDFNGQTALYIVNFRPQGFVILPSDDKIQPVLAYSTENVFPQEITNPAVAEMLDNYSNQVIYSIENQQNSEYTKTLWQNILNKNFTENKDLKSVSPLLTTHWDQSGIYNSHCPEQSAAGCVAIAMAQVMKYWNWPDTGYSWNGYRHPPFSGHDWGYLSAIFGETAYRWDEMLDNQGTDAAAELIYHCGVSVNMFYTPPTSAASSMDVPISLANYFRYKQSMQLLQRDDYADTTWKQILMTELDNAHPIPYSGSGSSGGHMFVCDGYDEDTLFHFNWGWGGYADGYYEISNLNPAGYDFSNYNDAVIGLEPDTTGIDSVFLVSKLNGYPHRFCSTKKIATTQTDNIIWTIPEDVYVGDTLICYQEVAKSFNKGASWSVFDLPVDSTYMPVSIIAKDLNNAQIAVVSLAKYNGNVDNSKILRTTDGGQTWTIVLDVNNLIISDLVSDTTMFIAIGSADNGKFRIYTFDGSAWQLNNTANMPDALTDENLPFTKAYLTKNPSGNNRLYFTTDKGRIIMSDDGLNWSDYQIVRSQPEDSLVIDLAFDNNKQNGIAHIIVFRSDTIYEFRYFKSTDAGATWNEFTPNGNFYHNGITFVPGANCFYSTGGGYEDENFSGISMSYDGVNWQNIPQYYTGSWFRNITANIYGSIFAGGFSIGYSVLPHKWGFWTSSNYKMPLIADFYTHKSGSQADSLFCFGDTVIFENNSIGEIDSFYWDFGMDADPQTQTGEGAFQVTYSTAGTKTISLIISNEYQSDTITKNIHIAEQNPLLTSISGDTLVQIQTSHLYSTQNYGSTFYTWTTPYSFWNTDSDSCSAIIEFTGFPMTGYVQVSAINGCGTSDTISFPVRTTGDELIINENTDNLTIFPNPAKREISIFSNDNYSMKILDNTGKVVDYQLINEGENFVNLNLNAGIYVVIFENEKQTVTKKLIVQ